MSVGEPHAERSWVTRRRLLGLGICAVGSLGCTGMLPTKPQAKRRAPSKRPEAKSPTVKDGVKIRPADPFLKPNGDAHPVTPGGALFELSMKHNGEERRAFLATPDDWDQTSSLPLVMACHGNGEGPQTMLRKNRWQRTINKRQMLGLFPETGNAGTDNVDNLFDDTSFLRAILVWVLDQYPVNKRKVYGVGFSGGCRRMYWLAGQHPELFAAIGVGSGTIGYEEHDTARYTPSPGEPSVSTLHIHGTLDKRVPIQGGPYVDGHGGNHQIMPTRRAVKVWSRHNKAKSVTPAPIKGVPEHVKMTEWKAETGHRVVLLVDDQLEHKWAEYANEAMLRFFQSVPTRSSAGK